MNLGVPIMGNCEGITSVIAMGEEIEVDMAMSEVTILRTGATHHYPPVPEALRQILQDGGRKGFLQKWLLSNPELARALEPAA